MQMGMNGYSIPSSGTPSSLTSRMMMSPMMMEQEMMMNKNECIGKMAGKMAYGQQRVTPYLNPQQYMQNKRAQYNGQQVSREKVRVEVDILA